MEEKEPIIELLNENNEPERFEHIMTLEYKEKPYLIMHPVDDKDLEEGEVVIFSIVTDDKGEEYYEALEDEGLLEEVFNEFLLILETDEEE
jgi:uncharacterized protein YrzB (UPF0473 family)